MLDICTGTGVVALAGARYGAAEVHAVDLSARAALAARWNARLSGLPVTVHRGDFPTLRALRTGGLEARVTARSGQPFGPVLRSRAAWLEKRGLIAPGQREEELVVVRARREPSGT